MTDSRKSKSPWRAMTLNELVHHLKAMCGDRGVLVMVGIPASGKSTVAEALAAAGVTRLSRDAIRGELYGDEAIQGSGAEVSRLFYARLEDALAAGKLVVDDSTNCDRLLRRPVIALAQHHGYENIVLVVMETPLGECLRRNRARDRVVPEKVIEALHARLRSSEKPRASEGRRLFVRPARKRGGYLVHVARKA